MPRPNKLRVETVTYNLTLPVSMKNNLSKSAHDKSKKLGKEISIADLIREKLYGYF